MTMYYISYTVKSPQRNNIKSTTYSLHDRIFVETGYTRVYSETNQTTRNTNHVIVSRGNQFLECRLTSVIRADLIQDVSVFCDTLTYIILKCHYYNFLKI